MVDFRKGSGKLGSYISIGSLIIGLIALYFSWQANQIASKQVTDNLVVISSEENNSSYTWTENNLQWIACETIVKLSNLGGAPASLITHEANLYFQNETYTVKSDRSIAYIDVPATKYINSFRVEYKTDTVAGTVNLPYDRLLGFPVKIDSYTTILLYPRAIILVDKSQKVLPGFLGVPNSPAFNPTEAANSIHLDVDFTYTLASGKKVTTPRILCFLINKTQ